MNQTVFGSEMVLLTFNAVVIQLTFVFVHFGVLLSKPYNRANWRFLLLIFLFIIYNLCSGLFPDTNIYNINPLLQNILAFGSGIALASFYFFFLVKEIEIEQRKFFNIKFLVTSLVLSFVILYVLTYFLFNDFNIARKVFIIPPVIIAIYFCVNTIKGIQLNTIKNSSQCYKYLNVAGKLGITFMATMPVVVAIGDYQLINNGLVNISFLLLLLSYYMLLIVQAKNEKELNYRYKNKGVIGGITEFGLTPRELEVAAFILKGENYNDLAEKMFINPKTVSKHASNIFKKTECGNREEFIRKFLNTYN